MWHATTLCMRNAAAGGAVLFIDERCGSGYTSYSSSPDTRLWPASPVKRRAYIHNIDNIRQTDIKSHLWTLYLLGTLFFSSWVFWSDLYYFRYIFVRSSVVYVVVARPWRDCSEPPAWLLRFWTPAHFPWMDGFVRFPARELAGLSLYYLLPPSSLLNTHDSTRMTPAPTRLRCAGCLVPRHYPWIRLGFANNTLLVFLSQHRNPTICGAFPSHPHPGSRFLPISRPCLSSNHQTKCTIFNSTHASKSQSKQAKL